ncbi:hypothetical protein SAMN04488239_12346 [Ruegeria marina]|uniref:Uncharacterized protein n=2 Tax=Ruegeria marina TaxID=639004 RepID=A0A1G7E2P6_9RHOB|nr:hypothetical protein SAMN04488239_12346 [Ruegeria marina]
MLHLRAEDHGGDLSVAVADQMACNAVREATAAQKVSLQSRNGMRNSHLVAAIARMEQQLENPVSPAGIFLAPKRPNGGQRCRSPFQRE